MNDYEINQYKMLEVSFSQIINFVIQLQSKLIDIDLNSNVSKQLTIREFFKSVEVGFRGSARN